MKNLTFKDISGLSDMVSELEEQLEAINFVIANMDEGEYSGGTITILSNSHTIAKKKLEELNIFIAELRE